MTLFSFFPFQVKFYSKKMRRLNLKWEKPILKLFSSPKGKGTMQSWDQYDENKNLADHGCCPLSLRRLRVVSRGGRGERGGVDEWRLPSAPPGW